MTLEGPNYFGAVDEDLAETGEVVSTQTHCLPPNAAGFPTDLTIRLAARTGGACADPLPTSFSISNVKLVEAAQCR